MTAKEFLNLNPNLTNVIVGATVGLIGLKIAMIGVSFIASVFTRGSYPLKLVMLTASHAIKAIIAAQWLWNAALTDNPIGLVITAVGALIGAGVLLYKNRDSIDLFGMILPHYKGGLNQLDQMRDKTNYRIVEQVLKANP